MSQKELTGEIPEPAELQADGEKRVTAADSQLNVTSAEQSKKLSEIPAEIFQLKESEADLKKQNKSIMDKLTGLESQLRQKNAENENVLAEIHTLDENEKIIAQKNKSLTAELADLQSLIEKKDRQIRKLKQKINELDWMDEDEYDNEAQVEYQIAKMEAEIKTVQKKQLNPQGRKEFLLDQHDHIVTCLTQAERHRDKLNKKSLELAGAIQELKYEIADAACLFVKSEDEIKKLNRIIADKQDQIDDLIEDREITEQPSLLQEERSWVTLKK